MSLVNDQPSLFFFRDKNNFMFSSIMSLPWTMIKSKWKFIRSFRLSLFNLWNR